jgi:hypothetical protein
MRTLFGYMIAVILAIISQFAHDQPWLGAALWYAAFMVTLLVTLGLIGDAGLFGRIAKLLRAARMVPIDTGPTEREHTARPFPLAKVPRPAGPVGPMPVLQRRPQNVAGTPIGMAAEKNTDGATGAQ